MLAYTSTSAATNMLNRMYLLTLLSAAIQLESSEGFIHPTKGSLYTCLIWRMAYTSLLIIPRVSVFENSLPSRPQESYPVDVLAKYAGFSLFSQRLFSEWLGKLLLYRILGGKFNANISGSLRRIMMMQGALAA